MGKSLNHRNRTNIEAPTIRKPGAFLFEEEPMNESIDNQYQYLAAWNLLKKLAKEQKIDRKVIDNLNRKNAETLMCDYLPIP